MDNSQPLVTTSKGLSFFSAIVAYDKYAAHVPSENRRETMHETLTRARDMFVGKYPQLEERIKDVWERSVYPLKVLPAMRILQYAGAPILQHNAKAYNCSFAPIDSYEVFGELMYLLLCGTGTGYSVQRRHISKLPFFNGFDLEEKPMKLQVEDSIEGWADATRVLIQSAFVGGPVIEFDYSAVRPQGSRLSSGVIAPGPGKLIEMHQKLTTLLKSTEQGNFGPLQAHFVMCLIAACVVSGGVRRSAMICLFDHDDVDMLTCKTVVEYGALEVIEEEKRHLRFHLSDVYGDHTVDYWAYSQEEFLAFTSGETKTLPWYIAHPELGRANNSACLYRSWTPKKQKEAYDFVWRYVEYALNHGSGDPAFFWNTHSEYGPNPCVEAFLSYNFCCLTEIVGKWIDSQETFLKLCEDAAFINTLQTGFNEFPLLRPIWQERTQEESLIGVGITGMVEGSFLSDQIDAEAGAKRVLEVNAEVARLIGVNPAHRCTVVKPSGTSTPFSRSIASGVHDIPVNRESNAYIRRMRISKTEPVYGWLMRNVPSLMEDLYGDAQSTAVLSIPIILGEDATSDVEYADTAVEFLERVKKVYNGWIRPGTREGVGVNNVSATCTLLPQEIKEVKDWMWKNRESYNGMSLLPKDLGNYKQMPYEPCSLETAREMEKYLVDFKPEEIFEPNDLRDMLSSDNWACAGGSCEIT